MKDWLDVHYRSIFRRLLADGTSITVASRRWSAASAFFRIVRPVREPVSALPRRVGSPGRGGRPVDRLCLCRAYLTSFGVEGHFSIYITLVAICDPLFFSQLPPFRVGADKERASRGVTSL
ncbi:hypothetical protein [Methylosinus sp. RM1]|uniref:hypothetical protein n=1 Tax=Methylosinus sp. RM1 TaxID=2583817 RepID=UPI00140DE48C|nr:hypothetical protein [Methylosinus sp. RM1]